MKKSDKELEESVLKIQVLNQKKRALEMELEKVNDQLSAIMKREKLIAFDPIKNIYLLNVNYRA